MILVSPAAFKGTLSPLDAAAAMADGVRRFDPDLQIRMLPLSDGGDGLVDVLHHALGGSVETRRVAGPLGRPVEARVLLLELDDVGRAAVVESADACGVRLLEPAERDPMLTHTRGVGELVAAAAATGADTVVVGLGGSATVDGGTGMARALGWNLLDEDDAPIPDGGAGLSHLERIEPPVRDPALPRVIALADVRSPLLGADGAAAVFGPQKGASAQEVTLLADGLARLAAAVARDLGVEIGTEEGDGAAGGLGAACRAFLGAELLPGADWVFERVGFEAALADADVVVTGEGAYDAQSGLGKVVGRVVAEAGRRGTPVALLAGSVEGEVPSHVSAVSSSGVELTRASLAALVPTALARMETR